MPPRTDANGRVGHGGEMARRATIGVFLSTFTPEPKEGFNALAAGDFLMHLGVGPLEWVILLLLAVAALAGWSCTKRAWMLAFPALYVIPMLFTPPDPASSLWIAGPSCCVYGLAMWLTRPVKPSPRSSR